MKTSELTGVALDWAVTTCEGLSPKLHGCIPYSTDWAQGGPIIERERIDLTYVGFDLPEERQFRADFNSYGSTMLIAAMRCYVASKLGDEIEIPDVLIK